MEYSLPLTKVALPFSKQDLKLYHQFMIKFFLTKFIFKEIEELVIPHRGFANFQQMLEQVCVF